MRLRLRGALVALVLLAATLLAWQRPDPFAHHATARAVFADAGSLAVVGADVRMAGTKVGEVTGRRRVGDAAEVTMRLEPAAGDLHADASAELRPRLAFEGTAFVDLHPGSPDAPALGGRPIPLRRTAMYVPLERVLRLADAPTRARLRGAARGLAGALEPGARRALRGALASAPPLLRDAAWATEATQGPRAGALRGAVQGLARTTSALAAREADLVPVLRSTARTARALDDPALGRLLAELPADAAALRTGGAALDGTLARLAPLARALRPGAAALAPTLRTVAPLLRNGAGALRAAGPLVHDLRAALPAGGRAAAPARTLLRGLAPTVARADASLLPALRATTPLGLPAYQSFLNLFEGGGGASRPFQTSADSTGGTGHFMRFGFRFLTGAGAPLPPCGLLHQASPPLADAAAKAGGCTP
jgi:phospholipid/cholesterol/gamma-HCH transport system substrate-binding protein